MNHTPWRFLPQDHLYSDCYNHGKSGYYCLRFRPQFALYRDCLLWLTLSKGDRLTEVYHLVLFDYLWIDLLLGINIYAHLVNRPHKHYSCILRE